MSTLPKNLIENISGDYSGNLTATNNITVNGKNSNITILGNTTVANNLDIGSNLTVNNINNVSNLTVSGIMNSGNINTNNVFIKGTLDLSGNMNVNNISVDILRIKKLKVSETVDISGNTTIDGSLDVSGNVNISTNHFTVNSMNGNTYIKGNIDCSGNTNIDGTLNVKSNTIINNNISTSGSIDCSGNATITGLLNSTSINVNNKTNIDSSGNIVTSGTLDCSGNTSIGGNLDVSGNMNININRFTVNSITGNTYVKGNIDCSGNTNIDGSLNVTGNTLLQSLRSIGKIDCSGNMSVDGSLNCTSINVNNKTKIDTSGNISTMGTLDCSGNTSIGGNLDVSGNMNVNINRFTVNGTNGNTNILGTLTVNGNTTLNGSTINIGTSGSTVNIIGNTNTIQTTHLQVYDNLITLNKGGQTSSMSGIEIEENGNIASYIKVSNTRDSFDVKVPTDNTNYTMVLKDPSGNCKIAGTLDCSGNVNIGGNVDCSGSIVIKTLASDASPSTIVFYNNSTKNLSYGPVPSTISLSGTNTWTGPTQFNSTLTATNITTLYGQSAGSSIISPSLVLVLNDWKTEVNNWSQGQFIVQNGPNNKCFYYTFGQFATDMYNNVSPPNIGVKFTKSSTTPSSPSNGDEWYNTSDGTIYKYIDGSWYTVKSLSQYIQFINSKLSTSYTSETLLYRASRDGFSNSTFHTKCDNKGATITIVTLTNGTKLGGFTTISWDSSSGYSYGGSAFLNNFTTNRYLSYQAGGYTNTYRYSTYGPTFGGGHDMYINLDSLTGGYVYINSYTNPDGLTIL